MKVHVTIRKGPRIPKDVMHTSTFEHVGPARRAVEAGMTTVSDWFDWAPDEEAFAWTDFNITVEK